MHEGRQRTDANNDTGHSNTVIKCTLDSYENQCHRIRDTDTNTKFYYCRQVLIKEQSVTPNVGSRWLLHLSACFLAEIVTRSKAYLWLAPACLAVD